MAHVGTFVEAVGQGYVRFGRLNRHTIGKVSNGSASKGEDGLGDVADSKLGCPATVDDYDLQKAIFGAAAVPMKVV